jgi:hypothetical protein
VEYADFAGYYLLEPINQISWFISVRRTGIPVCLVWECLPSTISVFGVKNHVVAVVEIEFSALPTRGSAVFVRRTFYTPIEGIV